MLLICSQVFIYLCCELINSCNLNLIYNKLNQSSMKDKIIEITSKYKDDRGRLMDILIDIHDLQGYVDDSNIEVLAERLGMSEVEVNETVSFYHFFTKTPSELSSEK